MLKAGDAPLNASRCEVWRAAPCAQPLWAIARHVEAASGLLAPRSPGVGGIASRLAPLDAAAAVAHVCRTPELEEGLSPLTVSTNAAPQSMARQWAPALRRALDFLSRPLVDDAVLPALMHDSLGVFILRDAIFWLQDAVMGR